MEDWIDAAFGELEPLQEPVDFLEAIMKEAEMVDAMENYYFEPQPLISRVHISHISHIFPESCIILNFCMANCVQTMSMITMT